MSDDGKTKAMQGIPGLRSLPARVACVALMILTAVLATHSALHPRSANGMGWWLAGMFWLLVGQWAWQFFGPRKGKLPEPSEPISLNLNEK